MTPTANNNKTKAVEHEKENTYAPHRPFQPRFGPGPGYLVSRPSALRRICGGKKMTEAKIMEQCQEMKAQKAKMKADMKVHDAQIAEQLAKMNRAPQNQKTDLMAAVVTQMVEQRIAMDARKAKMEEEMMQHMMQHMQMGKESMAKCPMMKGMKGMDGKSAGDHKAHQPEQK